jgi:acylphosphatase
LEAERLQVTGWVRNTADGAVEAVVQGSAPAVDALIRWAHSGPPLARVDRVEIGDAEGQFTRFVKRAD